jgi:hypothetical protein
MAEDTFEDAGASEDFFCERDLGGAALEPEAKPARALAGT